MRLPAALLVALVVAGCEPTPPAADVLSDYTLQLVPRVLPGQDPFATEPSVKLLIRHAEGGSEILYAGRAQNGQIALPDVGPLTQGTRIGLLLEEPGGEQKKYNPSLLIAYGDVTLDQDLAMNGAEVEAQILIPQFANLGELGRLQGAKKSFRPASAMLPGGAVYLFGGAGALIAPIGEKPSHGKILRMSPLDTGDWSFQKIGDLPEYTLVIDGGIGAPTEEVVDNGRAGAMASVVDDGGKTLILITGGRTDYSTSGYNIDTALLYDPERAEVVWGSAPADARMQVGRSDHGAVVLANGDVLLFGGFQGPATGFELGIPFEIFRVSDRTFLGPGGVPDFGDIGVAAASLGTDGAMICGGSVRAGTTWSPRADCNIVSLSGSVLPAPSLPVGVSLHAMAPLPNGEVLACGGVLDPVAPLSSESATNRAWVYDGSQWAEVSPMTLARAHHVAIPTPSGQVVIVGGGPRGGPVLPDPGEPVLCTEIFDPITRGFTTAGAACTTAGSGAYPSWSAVEGEGAFALAGFEDFFSDVGGDVYGFIGFGPDLQ